MKNELWKQVIIKQGKTPYQVSNMGRVRRWHQDIKNYIYLKPQFDRGGYLMVSICVGKQHCKYIHRLVSNAFIPNPYNKPQRNHKNGIKTDNRTENLEWVTAKENTNHMFDVLGRKGKKGQEAGNNKLPLNVVLDIKKYIKKFNRNHPCIIGLCEKYKVSGRCIQAIIYKQTWRHLKT